MTIVGDSNMRGVAARARALVLHPRSEWDVIAGEPATVRGLYTRYVMILAAIPAVAHFIGGALFGIGRDAGPFPIVIVAVRAIVGYLLSLASVYVMAVIIDAFAPYFGGAKNRMQAMKLAAYFPTAAWLAGVFALIPALGVLQVVGLYSLYLLYLGVPRLMRVIDDKASLYTIAVITAAVIVMLLASLAASLLTGGMLY